MVRTNLIKFGVDHATNSTLLMHDLDAITKSALLADSLNYDGIFFMDHLNWTPTNSQIANNWIFLSSLINRIKKSTLGILVTDPHRNHPAILAQMHATLDFLTDGRFILGIGAGEGANINQYGIKWDRPVSRLKEAIEVMQELWNAKSNRRANYNGEFFTLKDAFLQIKFKKSPQLWVAGNGTKTRELTAKYGTGWFPNSIPQKIYRRWSSEINDMAEKFGRKNTDIVHAYQIYIYLSEDENAAFNTLRPIMTVFSMKEEIIKEFNLKFPQNMNFHKMMTHNTLLGMKKAQRKVFDYSQYVPDSILKDMCAFGPVDNIISKLEDFIKAGVEYFVLMFIGNNYYEQIKEFSSKIIPYFQEYK